MTVYCGKYIGNCPTCGMILYEHDYVREGKRCCPHCNEYHTEAELVFVEPPEKEPEKEPEKV